VSIYKRGKTYWYSFVWDGQRVQASTRQRNREAARDIESAKRTALAKGEAGIKTPKRDRRTIGELLDKLTAEYEQERRLSSQNRSQITRARKDFGAKVATELTAEDVEKYVAGRKKQGDANATVNRTTEILRRAYKLAKITAPEIVHLSEKGNARKGFFSVEEFRVLRSHLPDDLKDFCHFAFITGWRRNEIRSLRWSDVEENNIRLREENAKNREARDIAIAGELVGIVERRRQVRLVDGVLTSLIFHRDGEPIGEFKKSWASACVAAGLGMMTCPKCGEPSKPGELTRCSKCKKQRKYVGKIFHDFRRSAARNLIRAGVNEKTCMEILGHKTRSMFDRYNITSGKDRAEAMERLERAQSGSEKVIAIAQ